jgi:hypothetical protein
MTQSDSGSTGKYWPIHSAHFWCGLLAGLGLGLLLAAALVELEALSTHRKAWASLLGAVLVGVGGIIGWRGQSGKPAGDEPAVPSDPRGKTPSQGS